MDLTIKIKGSKNMWQVVRRQRLGNVISYPRLERRSRARRKMRVR